MSEAKVKQLYDKADMLLTLNSKVEQLLERHIKNCIDKTEDELLDSFDFNKISELLSLTWKINKNIIYARTQAKYFKETA